MRHYKSILYLLAGAVILPGAPNLAPSQLIAQEPGAAWQREGRANGNAAAPLVPNQSGDFLPTKQKVLIHRDWQIVDSDPQGVNCRMPAQYQGLFFEDSAQDPTDPYASVVDKTFGSGKHNIGSWDIVIKLPKGSRIRAWGGNLSTQIIVLDQEGQPWMPVFVSLKPSTQLSSTWNKEEFTYCFVRANRRFIEAI